MAAYVAHCISSLDFFASYPIEHLYHYIEKSNTAFQCKEKRKKEGPNANPIDKTPNQRRKDTASIVKAP